MSEELSTTYLTSAQNGLAPKQDGTGPCVCLLPDGTRIVTTTDNCKASGGTPMVETPRSGSLFPYTLPSGNEIVGSLEDFQADGGRLAHIVDLAEMDPSELTPTSRVLCKLPSGLGIVETIDECLADGGTVVGKIRRHRS